jgi:hypothetical protein
MTEISVIRDKIMGIPGAKVKARSGINIKLEIMRSLT